MPTLFKRSNRIYYIAYQEDGKRKWKSTGQENKGAALRELIAFEKSSKPSIPITSVYSRTDGIVPWKMCLGEAGPRREAVEVRSSHCGMGHHPGTLWVIADRLAQPDSEWRPFDSEGVLARVLGVRTTCPTRPS